ncbi:MAG: c-type cytochrome [Planctomycetales bacterium]|nr:c-type cytochrome [Planctomycetales bacterium]
MRCRLVVRQLFAVALLHVMALGGGALLAADPATAARDAAVVQTILRLPGVNVNANPQLKASVMRHLETVEGTPKFLELVEKLKLRDASDKLLALAIEKPDDSLGVNAASLLVKFDELDRMKQVVAGEDPKAATAIITALGLAGGVELADWLGPVVVDAARPVSVRNAAATALGRSPAGQKRLLQAAADGTLPDDGKFSVANALLASTDATIREEAAKYLSLPATRNAEPLPPVAELVGRSGDAAHGRELFMTTATCGKCHKVRDEGKEVGPELSEIGSKLSRDALYVAILDPSAGISHNYETYTVLLDNGTVVTGLMVSETDEAVTIKTAEAILRTFKQDEIEEMIKQKVSLMPSNLQQTMSVQDLVDVVEYLTTLKKAGG